ncbi:MAG: hypothetical protein IJ840_09285 [Bacteroidales bacterium]|nr:hypothetical protein [Bacteroidales bacterium]
MNKFWTLVMSLAVVASCGPAIPEDLPMSVAHRGCWLKDGEEFYINENCPAGVRMAAQYGYPAIECDVKYTLDSVMVIMHDATINRTMRNASDYSKIEQPVKVTETTFEELRTKYVLESTDPALRTPIPTLQEELDACKEYGVMPMLHSAVVESYKLAHEVLGDNFVAFDVSQKALSHARDYSDCLILLDPGKDPAERTVERLKELGGKCGMSTMGYKMLDANYIQTVKDAGFDVQASIFPAPHEQRAVSDGVTIQLSDFWWYQTDDRKPIGTFRKISMRLPEGQSVEWNPEAPEFAAVTLAVDFTGTLEITMAGKTYVLTHEAPGKVEVIGTRLYKAEPGIKVRALVHSQVKSLKVDLYDCGKA